MGKKAFSKEQGMILIVGIIFLLILTLIGITALNSTVLSEKMSQNLRDTNIAFEASESALGDGEQWLQMQPTPPPPITSCTISPCRVWQSGVLTNIYKNSNAWWQINGILFSGNISSVAQQPRYIIEQYAFVPYELSPDALSTGHGYYYYRVTARGVGTTGQSFSNIESIYCTQYN